LVVTGASFVHIAHIIELEFIKLVESLFAVAKPVDALYVPAATENFIAMSCIRKKGVRGIHNEIVYIAE